MIESDAALLARSAEGDADAFERFVDRYEGSVFGMLVTLADSRADAEDALQDAFVAAWKSAASFAGADSAKGWLLTIARHALARQRRLRVGEPSSHEPIESVESLGRRAGWASGERDAMLDRLADRELVERALGRLPREEREVVVLRDVQRLSGEEVAAMIGVSLAAMKSRLHRGRLRLAAALREEDR